MDFSLDYTPAQEEFRREVAAWLEANVPKGLTAPADLADLSHEEWLVRRDFARKLGAKGWLAAGYPKEYGGGGLSWEYCLVLEDELDRYNLNPPTYDLGVPLVAPSLSVWGTDEQKQRLLPPIFRGEIVTWQLFTEPEAGSDLAGLKTKAVRDGDDYVINGHKIFVGGHHDVDQFWCLTNTAPDGPRHKNLSMFLVPSETEGVTITPLDLIAVPSSGKKNAISLDNVRVPAWRLIGGLNNGWAVTNSTLEVEHGGLGGVGMNKTLVRLFDYCRSNPAMRQRIEADPVIADTLAQLYIDGDIERLFSMRNFWMKTSHKKMTYESPQMSFYKKTNDIKLAAELQQILGPVSLTRDPELSPLADALETFQRFSIITAPGGTPDVQKVILSRRLGIGRAIKEEAAKL